MDHAWHVPWASANPSCFAGERDTPDFASEIVSTQREGHRIVDKDGQRLLLLGVPIFSSACVSAVFEIVQRDIESEAARKGYVLFMKQIAETSAPFVS